MESNSQRITPNQLRQIEDAFWDHPYDTGLQRTMHEARNEFHSHKSFCREIRSAVLMGQTVVEARQSVCLSENPDSIPEQDYSMAAPIGTSYQH
ncbi:MAG: hypothetical protein KAK00_04865 [Nanoarchaeota archaeon]|nr:hypothetical protein [Nanoarchaeota archaeon]